MQLTLILFIYFIFSIFVGFTVCPYYFDAERGENMGKMPIAKTFILTRKFLARQAFAGQNMQQVSKFFE